LLTICHWDIQIVNNPEAHNSQIVNELMTQHHGR